MNGIQRDMYVRNTVLIILSMLGVNHPDSRVKDSVDRWVKNVKEGRLDLRSGIYTYIKHKEK